MSSTAVAKLSPAEVQQLSLSYAAFLLADAGAKVNAQALQTVLDAAGIKAEKLWVDLFAKTLATRPVETYFGATGGSSAGSGSAPADKKEDKKDEKKDDKKGDKKKEEKKEAPPAPVVEEDTMDMGGLFD